MNTTYIFLGLLALTTVQYLVLNEWVNLVGFVVVMVGYLVLEYHRPRHQPELIELQKKVDGIQTSHHSMHQQIAECTQIAQEARDLGGKLALAAGMKFVKKEQ